LTTQAAALLPADAPPVGQTAQATALVLGVSIAALAMGWAALGIVAGAMSTLPVMVVAWRHGWRGGAASTLLLLAVQFALAVALGPGIGTLVSSVGFQMGTLVLIGLGVGIASDRLRESLGELRSTRRALLRSEETLHLAAEGTRDGLWTWERRTNRFYVSPQGHSMLKYGLADLAPLPEIWVGLVHPEDRDKLDEPIGASWAEAGKPFSVEFRLLCGDGSWRWVLCRGMSSAEKAPRRLAGWLTDISEAKAAESALRRSAFRDSLTGLANRALLLERLEHAEERARRPGQAPYGVLLLDLDSFKLVNDSSGHSVGDELLIEVGRRLQTVVRPGDTVARLGGDEFVVVLEAVDNPQGALHVAARVVEALGERIELTDAVVPSSASIGVVYVDRPRPGEELLRDADIAMYRAKGTEVRAVLYDTAMHAAVLQDLELRSALRGAVARNEFRLVYQPIVMLSDRRIVGAEALARWRSPDLGEVAPARFISAIEDSGGILEFGDWALEEAARARRRLADGGIGDPALRIAVNLSPRQLRDPDLYARVMRILDDAGVAPQQMCLEITESAVIDDPKAAGAVVGRFSDAGFAVSLDDFGTGYSSLSAVLQLPIHTLKIDHSFVSGLDAEAAPATIVESVLGMARGLGLQTVGEGVETPAQEARLQELGCVMGQGYWFGRPMERSVFEALLREGPAPA